MTPILAERTLLQEMEVDALAYGAKDTGEMGGGAAQAIMAACGPELLPALRMALAESTRQIGDAVITDSYGLRDRGVRWVVHVLSIIKHTPEGAWCPQPDRLYDGILKGLRLAAGKGARSIAFSMLGTGEGRVKPEQAARLMIRAVRDFHRSGGALRVHFALPTYRDHEAVQSVLAGSSI